MNERKFYCYLDDFDEMTIIVPLKNYRDNNTYKLVGNDETVDLLITEKINLGIEVKLVCFFDAYIRPELVYYVQNEEGEQSELHAGKIVRSELFDNIYAYKKNDLGFTYTTESTKFKVWTPVAKSVRLDLIDKTGKAIILDMLYTNSGVWRLVVVGNLDGWKYRYLVKVNGVERISNDPYGISSNANGEYQYVIDRKKLYLPQNTYSFSGDPVDAVIYEMSVRDFSMDPSVPFRYPGKFLALTETGLKTPDGHPAGIDYLKQLGVTHVQIMPFFDFDGVDENHPGKSYNWGYNPQQYNVPEGWFSTDPNDPYKRINELKQMIDALHGAGIGVIMDVVYNHVFDPKEFPFEKLVPGYAYHVDRQGIYTNVSGCNNDLATHRKMVRKFIIESVMYWINEYKIDGFRFDLMGLIDTETMNELRQEVRGAHPHVIIYGEGWKMYSFNQADRMAHMQNKQVIYTIGFFNDRFRETIKGKTFDLKVPGFATGSIENYDVLKEMILGSARNRYMFKYASQSINYVECHDNNTFFDKAITMDKNVSVVRKQALLAIAMVLLSQGVPFLHAGQEFFRTKQGVENSYVSGDVINKFDWRRLDEFYDDVLFVQRLIALRKSSDSFKLKSSSDLMQYADVILLKSGTAMYNLTDGTDLMILFKPKSIRETILIPESYDLLLASTDVLSLVPSEVELNDIGTYVFQRQR